MMTWLDLMWIPLVGVSLTVSAAALGAHAVKYWRDPSAGMISKVFVATTAVAWLFIILMGEWYLAQRFAAAVMSFF